MRRFDTIFENLLVSRVTIDFPSVGSNATVTIDTAVTGVALGTHLISWTPVTDASSMDDLLIQFLIVDTDLVRTILQNPTGGAIDPGSIDWEFLSGTIRAVIDP